VLLVHHPHDDQTLFIRRGQFLVLIVPLDDHYVALVTLKVLVHGKVATGVSLARFKFQDFEKTLVATCSEVAFLLVPADHVEHGAIRHRNLQATKMIKVNECLLSC